MRFSTAAPLAGQLLLLLGANAQLQPMPALPYTAHLGCYNFLPLLQSGTARLFVTATANPGDPDECQAACALRGSPYVGLQRTECYCQDRSGMSTPSINPAGDEFCTTPCQSKPATPCGAGELPSAYITVYGRRNLVPQPSVGYQYVGCFDSEALSLTSLTSDTNEPFINGDPVRCQRACNNLGSPYIYMEDERCACIRAGSPSVPVPQPVSDSLCDRSCTQNTLAPCGGGVLGERMRYATAYGNRGPLTPAPQRPYNYLGCFQDDAASGATFEDYPDFGGLPSDCQNMCNSLGSPWMYMFRGECRCHVTGDLRPTASPMPDEECNIACVEAPGVACGGKQQQQQQQQH